MRSKTLISLLLLAVIYVMASTNVPFFKSKKKGTDSKHPIENNDSTNNNSTDSIPSDSTDRGTAVVDTTAMDSL